MARALRFGPGDARAIYEYNRDVFERYARRLRRLPKREAFRNREIGHLSLFGTLVHILNVHQAWLTFVVPGLSEKELDRRFRDPTRHPTDWRGFDAYAERVWREVDSYLRGLTARELGRRLRAPWMPGRYTVRDALLQTTLEQAHHVGEIIGAMWQQDRAPPEMTWIDSRRGPRSRR